MFNGYATYHGAVFNDSALFEATVFEESVDFAESVFASMSFRQTTFGGPTSFWLATFKGSAEFIDIAFPGPEPTSRVAMLNVLFEKPSQVRLETDISWFHFLGTDIEKIDFRNAK